MMRYRLAFLVFAVAAAASPDYQLPTGQCSPYKASTSVSFCWCTGRCRDGTVLGEPGGDCEYWYPGAVCMSLNNPTCGENQIFKLVASNQDPEGSCDDRPGCEWVRYSYEWECCDCPSGYWGQASDCDGYLTVPGYCLGCATGEALKWNDNSQNYICDGPSFRKRACDMINANHGLITTMSFGTTALSALCPTGGLPSVIQTLIGDAVAAYKGFIAKNPADPTAPQAAAVQILASFSAFLLAAGLAPEIAELSAALSLAWIVACRIRGVVGGVLTALTFIGDSDLTCPKTIPREMSEYLSISGRNVADDDPHLGLLSGRAQSDYNPCLELFNHVPATFDSIPAIDSACQGIAGYWYSDTLDAGVANTTATLSQFCNQYQSSGNSTILSTFSNLLSALRDAIPNCNLDSDGSLIVSASKSSQTSVPPTTGSVDTSAPSPATTSLSSQTSTSRTTVSSTTLQPPAKSSLTSMTSKTSPHSTTIVTAKPISKTSSPSKITKTAKKPVKSSKKPSTKKPSNPKTTHKGSS